jgi:hypothetical protein
MDNLFELIIFFFVIYSIISSLFGKKKKPQTQQRKKPVQYRSKPEVDTKTSTAKPSNKDILEELFGFKIPQPETEPQSTRNEKYDENLEYSSWDPEKEFDKKVKQRESVEYRNIEKDVPDINYDKEVSLEKKKLTRPKSVFQEYETIKKINKKAIGLRNKLRNPETFRDMFIISEIINKPKALRNR